MIEQFPSEGWSAFVLIAQGEVVYGTHTDSTTWLPKRHRESELFTPYGWVGPIEQNHQHVHQLLHGVRTAERWQHSIMPMITADGKVYQLDANHEYVDVRYVESGEWFKEDIETYRAYTLSTVHSQVIGTIYHLTHSIDAVLDHLERFHGMRRQNIVRRTIADIAAECKRRNCLTPIERLKHDTNPRKKK